VELEKGLDNLLFTGLVQEMPLEDVKTSRKADPVATGRLKGNVTLKGICFIAE
jgi:hypothetical protein